MVLSLQTELDSFCILRGFFFPANPAFWMYDFNEKMKLILGLSVEDLQLKSFDEWLTS